MLRYILFALGYIAFTPGYSLVVRLLRAPSDLAFYSGAIAAILLIAAFVWLSQKFVKQISTDLSKLDTQSKW